MSGASGGSIWGKMNTEESGDCFPFPARILRRNLAGWPGNRRGAAPRLREGTEA